MTEMQDAERNRYNPINELQKRLMLASGPKAELAAYMHFLPAIITFSPTEAIAFAGKAERVATVLQEWGAQVEILQHRAHASLRLNNPSAALEDLRLACGYNEETGDAPTAVRISITMGEALLMQGEPVAALRSYQKAMELSGAGASSLRADALHALADLHISTGDYDKAIEFLREALMIRNELNERDGIGRALCAMGTAFGKMGDLAMAYDYHQQSLEVFRETGDATNEVRALANLASIHQTRGELNDAIELAWKAHAACDAESDWATSASITITIADLHQRQGEPDLALRYYLKAYELLQKRQADDLLLGLYRRIGRIHECTLDFDAAQHVYRLAIEIAETIGERQVRSELHRAISGVFERKGYYQEALAHYQHFAKLQHELAGEEQHRRVAEGQTKYNMLKVEHELNMIKMHAQKLEDDAVVRDRKLTETQMSLTGRETQLRKFMQAAEGIKKGSQNGKAALDDFFREIDKHPEENAEPEDEATAEAKREWERLKLQLEKTYPDFLEKLFAICPSLTMTEVKICALTKILGQDSNEIARVLHNTVRTLQTQRFKIRKKLVLDQDVNFVTFIESL